MSQYVCGYVIFFVDGPPEGQALCVGDWKDCERLSDLVPAISYSGSRKMKETRMLIMPVEESIWDISRFDAKSTREEG